MANLDILKSAGMNIETMSADEQEALSRLDDAELEALAAIRNKLNADPDVEGYALQLSAPVVKLASPRAINPADLKIDPSRFADGYVVW